MNTPAPSKLFKYGLLVFIALIWGSQFMINKLVLVYFTPEGLSFFRALIAFLTLSFLIPFTSEKKTPLIHTPKQVLILFLIGLLEATLPFYLISYGQLVISSSMTAILMASIALFTLALVFLFFKQEKISFLKFSGVFLGFMGVLVLVAPDIHMGLKGNLLGELAVLGGAFCFSSSLVLIRAFCQNSPPIRTARMILFSAVIQLGVLSIILRHAFWHQTPPLHILMDMMLLGVLAGGIVYVLYVMLIRAAGATFTGFTNYLVPLVGVLMGVFILNEPIQSSALIGMVIILFSMGICEF